MLITHIAMSCMNVNILMLIKTLHFLLAFSSKIEKNANKIHHNVFCEYERLKILNRMEMI